MGRDRSLVRVAGYDADSFLQGLITNDMQCLHGDCEVKSMYSHLLNVQGRVLFDLILYNISSTNDTVFLVECDAHGVQDLIKLLKRYKIRKKVDIAAVGDEYSVWSVFPKAFDASQKSQSNVGAKTCRISMEEQYSTPLALGRQRDVVIDTPDPRLRSFARRLILPQGIAGCDIVNKSVDVTDTTSYATRRYQLGIAEGFSEAPPGNAIPLEYNVVFMNGVSFNKGCYVGQELIARTHHTGVIRKRIMPLIFSSCHQDPKFDDKVANPLGKNSGKF